MQQLPNLLRGSFDMTCIKYSVFIFFNVFIVRLNCTIVML